MNEFKTTKGRSKIMAHIHSENTKPEVVLRRALWSKGIHYRKNYKKLVGKPDIAITKYKIAVFIDGEFWHGYNWKTKRDKIRRNRSYWVKKIEGNMKRDQKVNEDLRKQGWVILRFWSNMVLHHTDYCVERILFEIRGKS